MAVGCEAGYKFWNNDQDCFVEDTKKYFLNVLLSRNYFTRCDTEDVDLGHQQ